DDNQRAHAGNEAERAASSRTLPASSERQSHQCPPEKTCSLAAPADRAAPILAARGGTATRRRAPACRLDRCRGARDAGGLKRARPEQKVDERERVYNACTRAKQHRDSSAFGLHTAAASKEQQMTRAAIVIIGVTLLTLTGAATDQWPQF